MKTNKRPNISSLPLNCSKNPTIPLIPQNPHNSTNTSTTKKPASLPKRRIQEEFLDHNSNVSVANPKYAKRPEKTSHT